MRPSSIHSPKGYSILLSLIMIGFLLVLTSGTLNLVLQEMQDGKGKQDYLKASAAAEGSLEVALLHIKEKGYGYYDILTGATLLGTGIKDPAISYDLGGKIQSYSGVLNPDGGIDIIPLFWINTGALMQNIGTDITFNSSPDIAWNIISENGGISGTGSFQSTTNTNEKKEIEVGGNIDFSFTENIQIGSYLSGNTGSYLMLYNASNTRQSYTLSTGTGYFTPPKSILRSSAQLGKYTQNLETVVDNTQFLGILKYSVYSQE